MRWLCSHPQVYMYSAPSIEEDTMVSLVAVSLVAVALAYVALRAWHKRERVKPPWGMSEFHHRLGRGHPKRSERVR